MGTLRGIGAEVKIRHALAKIIHCEPESLGAPFSGRDQFSAFCSGCRGEEGSPMKTDDRILVAGAGGFIGGALVRYLHERGAARIRAVDKKPLPLWYQRTPGVECLSLDLSEHEGCRRAVEGAAEVYNLAADMGGMGFIERFRIECLRSILINTHLIEAAYRAGVVRYFFSSSACAYNTRLQEDPHSRRRTPTRPSPSAAMAGRS
jgi:nucleoside-diphosphate-sugar epimerase